MPRINFLKVLAKDKQIRVLMYNYNTSSLMIYIFVHYIFQYIVMSPKVAKEVLEPRSSNIKNIYIHKINSLMKISKDTIEKSQIEALNHTNRKKIKKHLSEAEKNTIRLQKNRQSAKKARQRKKIYVKLLEQQEKRLNDVLQQTQQVEKISSEYVEHLSNKRKQVTTREQRPLRKSSDNNIDKVSNNIPYNKESVGKLEDKITLLKQIIGELTELSKYAYWKERKADDPAQNEAEQVNTGEEDFFNIEEVLADIEVVHMKNENFDMNLDDLLNVPYEDEQMDDQRQRYDIKSLIADQYETVSRCLHELELINSEAQELLQTTSIYRKQILPPGQDFKNPELAQFKKNNTIVPQYEIKKIKPRRIDSLNSLSSANRSIMGRSKSLFALNNYFINMEQAETKILFIDRAIQEINRILSFEDSECKEDKEEDFSMEKI